jgi:hypothetical protein
MRSLIEIDWILCYLALGEAICHGVLRDLYRDELLKAFRHCHIRLHYQESTHTGLAPLLDYEVLPSRRFRRLSRKVLVSS